jgi:hypothetical protein
MASTAVNSRKVRAIIAKVRASLSLWSSAVPMRFSISAIWRSAERIMRSTNEIRSPAPMRVRRTVRRRGARCATGGTFVSAKSNSGK